MLKKDPQIIGFSEQNFMILIVSEIQIYRNFNTKQPQSISKIAFAQF